MLVAFAQVAVAETTVTSVDNCVIQEVLPGKAMTGAFVTFHHQGPAVDIIAAEIPSITSHVELHSMAVSYTHLTLPTILRSCRSRWSPYH